MPDLSIVVPAYNEHESLPELTAWIRSVTAANSLRHEIVFVDDGSDDSTWRVIADLAAQYSGEVRGIRFRINYGKSAALNVGFEAAQGDVVITMDADLQDSPDEIPELYRLISQEGYDLVSGWKRRRYDPISKTLPSKFFNWVTRKVSGVHLNDFNCGLKAYRREVVKSIEVYGEMHRYIPFLAANAGFKRIGEKVVQHRARKYGKTKFGLERFVNGFLDILSLAFILRYGRKPMHFFGTLGIFSFFIGVLIALYLLIKKQVLLATGTPITEIRAVVAHPQFYLAIAALIIGMQLFLTGFVAELVNRKAPDRNQYLISEDTAEEAPTDTTPTTNLNQ